MPLTPLRIADDITRTRHAEALRALLDGEVRFDLHNRMLYATDASIYQVEPIGVVIPAHDADLDKLIAYCAERRLPLLPRGGGTSLAGQCVNHAVVVDLSRTMIGLNWVDAERKLCGVQPGITIDDLNDRLRAAGHGLFFAADPATARQCNIGGAIGNNAAGTRSIRYGRTSESVEAVQLLLASGERTELSRGARDPVARRLARGVLDICARYEPLIRARFPKTIRRNAGYGLDMMLAAIDEARATGADALDTLNLAKLICGAEGTLGVVTGATLRLHPVPKAKGLVVIGFDTLDDAISAVVPLLGLGPSAVELLDDTLVSLAKQNLEYRRYVDLMPQPESGALAAILYVEFFSERGPEEIAEKFEQTRALIRRHASGAGFAGYTDATSMAQALKLRKAGEPLLHAIPGNRKPLGFVEDNAVPVERLGEFVSAFRHILDKHGTRAAFWAHASVGVLHVRPLLDMRDEADREHMEAIAVEVADLARSLGGVMSGEHGDGRVRGPLLERFYGPELMRAFREVKELFDSGYLLNPGNIVPLGGRPAPISTIHEQTRVRPLGHNLRAAHIDTFFNYADEGGFDHAVELCNGSGVCRKKQGGTMCPSYMATLDERHTTRGRGNALRLAITGQLNPLHNTTASDAPAAPVWNDSETLETLRLCLSCKACKSECPTNVDIAQYKAEYQAQSYKAAGATPLRAKVFGHVRILNRLGSRFAPLSNWIASSALNRTIVNPLLGLDRRRTLPRFERSLFHQAAARYPSRRRDGALVIGDTGAPVVVLFADCFTTYNEPRIGLATIEALRAFGYSVALVDAGCCARALISTGCLEDAQRTVAQTSARLLRSVDRLHARAVLVCEPSCLSAIKDDWHKLKPPPEGAGASPQDLTRLSEMSFLPEDFLDRLWEAHPARPEIAAPPGAVVLHGHCHQKALWGAETSARLLARVAPGRVRVLDTGCCGMAGSFGYTADRYDLSMRIGELALFPAARALGPEDTLIAPGTSCRHQIHDGAQRETLHPMEFLARLMVASSGTSPSL